VLLNSDWWRHAVRRDSGRSLRLARSFYGRRRTLDGHRPRVSATPEAELHKLGDWIAVTEWITGTRMLIPLGFGLALWSFAAGSMHTIAPRRRKLAGRILLASAICAMAGAITVALNIKPAAIAIAAVLLVGGAIMTWYIALAERPTPRR
jgi:hypothetical protein